VLLTSGVFVVGRSTTRSIAHCRTTLLFLSTLKLARNFVFASWISCSLCSSNWSCSSAGRVSQVGSMILLGETLELSLEPTIEGRSDGPISDLPIGVAKKCVGADLGANHCVENRRRCSLHRHEWSATWSRARVPCLTDRTVRAYRLDGPRVRRGGGVRRRRLNLAPGGTPSWRRGPRCCLGSAGRHRHL
jgi:hypothetical protein